MRGSVDPEAARRLHEGGMVCSMKALLETLLMFALPLLLEVGYPGSVAVAA